MDAINPENEFEEMSPGIQWGHFGAVVMAMVLILGISWMEKPDLFSVKKSSSVSSATQNVPRYYAYVAPADSLSQPAVLGASTNPGPSVINEDGSISPVDVGEVLGASTQGVVLSLASVKVNSVPDSAEAMQKYLVDAEAVKNGPIDNIAFETALSSGNQNLINEQAQTLILITDNLKKLPVPQGLAKLHKLTIIQYQSAIGVLQNFTQADSNPELVGEYLGQFIKSQQDLDAETSAVSLKYNLNPIQLGSVMDSPAAQNAQTSDGQNLPTDAYQNNSLNNNVQQ